MKKIKMLGIEIDAENVKLIHGLNFIERMIENEKTQKTNYDSRKQIMKYIQGAVYMLDVMLHLHGNESEMIMSYVKKELFDGVTE